MPIALGGPRDAWKPNDEITKIDLLQLESSLA